jgi:7-cyano-7-deazaguanine synthase
MDKAVVLVSGGIAGSVAAVTAREQYETALLHLNWGHRAADRELAAFNAIATHLKTESVRVVDLPALAGFGGNARTNRKPPVEETKDTDGAPASFAFGLLPTAVSIAATWAHAIGATRIILGTIENPATLKAPLGALYPDYRREFVQAANLMLQYARPPGRELLVEAPLIELTREEVVKLGDLAGLPFDKTWSCYAAGPEPCNRCLGCLNRAAGFINAGLPDPLLLEPAAR